MWRNRFTPLYLYEPTPQSVAYAAHLKESVGRLEQSIFYISDDDVFAMKSAYSDNTQLASVDYYPEDAGEDTPTDFDLQVVNYATPQVNRGKYIEADQIVELSPGSYSFDLITNKLHYELQFNINEDDTNISLQNKLARLINASNIGVVASVSEKNNLSSLEIKSTATGIPIQGEHHFTIDDEHTSYTKGVVKYLGINDSISDATNAVYTINGKKENSYSNTFTVNSAYHITLHPESTATNAHIGLSPDAESLSNNIQTFVDRYNSFLNGIVEDDDETITKILSTDLKKFLDHNRKSLSKYGITINKNSTLTYDSSTEVTDFDTIKDFGGKMLDKLCSIELDPMEYVGLDICSYQNPNTTYPNPYVTSVYSGMMINAYA
jgi:flagellar hook-associated protein 2